MPLFLLIAFTVGLLAYLPSFGVFFTQDDFLLISHFSGNGFFWNLYNVFGPPTVSHWRPFFNLFFTISGSLFGKNYQLYHLLLLLLLICESFLVYKISHKLFKDNYVSSLSGLLFLLHPAFFTAVYWISGGAVSIGFLFFLTGFYFLVNGKSHWALIFLILSFLGSESMVVGSVVYAAYLVLFKKKTNKYALLYLCTGSVFGFIRFFFLTTPQTLEAYKLSLSYQTLEALRFYMMRILGIKAGGGINFASILIFFGLLVAAFGVYKSWKKTKRLVFFTMLFVVLGLFPFVLIPYHVSGHYMAMSIWGFSVILALGFYNFKRLGVVFCTILLAVYSFNNLTVYENSWIISRSQLAKAYLQDLEKADLVEGSRIVIADSLFGTSQETYVALGTGKAIGWWFSKKDYKVCFTAFENCEVNKVYVPFR